MVTVQKMSGSERALTKEGRKAILNEFIRRYANKHFGTHVPAKSDELSRFAKEYVRIGHAIQRVMEDRYPEKYKSWDI